ncbi:hypothetical protein [Laedolimicola ammoniilytica]|uniref:Uncharacterized protein n=1 Tax=Laedolimicola ammoniilytica TaxID=2981771 RepID=A0ABT2RTC2_9FIRM|nr:hypothetical protein [Laedolimicola ammoniilytica]MCU6695566.1 hypothetical protein [Laedolimicola ammoniilytica]SCH09083.1 Uncharacterised protein [uncultured Clostridium sp.]
MRMYLRELDYDNTLIMLAKFMEIREQKPFFSTDSLLLWLKSSLEDGEKLNIKSTAEDAADGVTVNVNIQIIKGNETVHEAEGTSKSFTDSLRPDVSYDSRNYAYKNAYADALKMALMILGFSSETLLMELTCAEVITEEGLRDKIRMTEEEMEIPEVTGKTTFVTKNVVEETEVACRAAEKKAAEEAEMARQAAEKKAAEEAEAARQAAEKKAAAEAEVARQAAEKKAAEEAEVAHQAAEKKAAEEAEAVRQAAEKKAAEEAEAARQTAKNGHKLTIEEALNYKTPANAGGPYSGKPFRDIYDQRGKAAVISFAKYYLSKATPEDPMVEVYRTLLDGAMELK